MDSARADWLAAWRRSWRVLRPVLGGLVLLWFGWFAYVRWTTPPAAEQSRQYDWTAVALRLEELERRLSAVPTYRPPTATASSGYWYWREPLYGALLGSWDPAGRPHLAAVAQWVSSAPVSQSLDRLTGLLDELRQMGPERPHFGRLSAANPGLFVWVWRTEGATITLALRARVRHADGQDLAGAAADLRTALYLQSLLWEARMGSGTHVQPNGIALVELIHLAQEKHLPPAVAAGLIHFLRDELPFSARQALASAAVSADEIRDLLDTYYTDDGRGNGWLVVSKLPAEAPWGSTGPLERSRFWNLFSPLFNDRKQVAAKLAGINLELNQLDGLDYAGLMTAVQRQSGPATNVSLLDGPLARFASANRGQTAGQALADLAWRRAAVVMLALSAYRHEHGEYPDALEQLVPDFLGELPRDLMTNGPFAYERRGLGTYHLGSRAESLPEPSLGYGYGPLNVGYGYSIRRRSASEDH